MIGAGTPPASQRFLLWMTLILLLAAAFRLVTLTTTPPGMTHDEAAHGITAQAILDGARDIYFTIGYGREPLYDYVTAGLMAGIGETIFTARLTAAFFSLVLVAGLAAWARQAFGSPVALLAAAGLAVGFWPVMAGRQALRSIALPALFVLAVCLLWWALRRYWRPVAAPASVGWRPWALLVAGGVLLGMTFYTYIPARVLWLIFPALVVYLMLVRRDWLPGVWARLGLFLGVAALVAAPLAWHLLGNPGLEQRINGLSAPLSAAAAGDLAPLLSNIGGSLGLFTVEGDTTWRYNLPGRPWLLPVVGALFYGGLGVAAWLAGRGLWRRPATPEREAGAFLALAWLALGLAPVLVTGPELSMTQAIGLLPMLYLFPALAAWALYQGAARLWQRQGWSPAALRLGAAALAFAVVGWGAAVTARDYFDVWANSPEVRVQYETTMVEVMTYLNAHGGGATAISTVTPGRVHTPAVAQLALHNPDVQPRWFDARQSWLLPEGGGMAILPGFTPPAAALLSYLTALDEVAAISMRPTDLDRPVRVLMADEATAQAVLFERLQTTTVDRSLPTRFGEAADLVGFEPLPAIIRPGEALQIVTAWRLREPLDGAMLFVQLIGPDGLVVGADQLGAPGESWEAGDTLLQLHTLIVPRGTPPGDYALITGLYTQPDSRRLPVDGAAAVDFITLGTVEVLGE